MTATPTAPAQADENAIGTVLRSPRLFSREVMAGVVTALALVPEVISFSFITGVDPKTALVSSIVLCLVMSVLGGRPAMVTAAAGSIALVVGPMVQAHGTGYILPTILLAGVIQIVFGVTGMARLARFIPRSVMLGFVNALGVLIFAAQVPHVLNVPWMVYPLFALTVVLVLLTPRVTSLIPGPLVAIVVVTALVIFGQLQVPSVGSEGDMSPGLPGLTPFLAPLEWSTLAIVWPSALSVAFVGLLETLLTAKLVDEVTDTRSHKSKESWALGVANICAGFYGGVAGCAMIGQTVVNVKIGRARTRISTIAAGLTLLLLVTVLSGLMAQIPMASLAAVMMIVALTTIDWRSISPATLKRMPLSETSVMMLTIIVTIVTGNLALGICSGVFLAFALFARRVAHVVSVQRMVAEDGAAVRYEVSGPLFFGSSNDLFERFSYAADPQVVRVDLSRAQIWDASTVAILDAITNRYRDHGIDVSFMGLDQRSSDFHARLSGHL